MIRIALWLCTATILLAFSVEAASPKLLLVIYVDQLRYDYLERYGQQFTTNGFRRLTERGSFATFAHYNYVPTVTGPGHASVLSGATPASHGIMANEWYDRKAGKDVYCVEDQSVDGVGATPAGARVSPKNFIGDNLADEMRLALGSKVVAISMKDRGAVLPGGKKPTGAFWFHAKNGNFVTSTYYMTNLPEWVERFNARKLAAQYVGRVWERLLDERFYPEADEAPGEGLLGKEKNPVFNHKVPSSDQGFDDIIATPYGNEMLLEFAKAAMEGEKLGRSNRTDLLSVSFSSVDYVGHRFGPYSQEVHDVVLRLDRQLNELFNYLDDRVGAEDYVVVLTADHGVAPAPEFATKMAGLGERWDEGEFLNDLKTRLNEEFGFGRYLQSSKFYGGNLYLNHAAIEKKKLNLAEVTSFIRDVALASGKFQACYSRAQLLEGRATGPIGALVVSGYNAERGGDVVLIPKPFMVPGTGKTGTTHGSAFSYDTHVPVLFSGAAFKPGRYAGPFAVTDIVPTLCTLLHINEPAGCVGTPCQAILNLDDRN